MISSSVTDFTNLRLTIEERQWLQDTCPYLELNYLSYLSEYRFKPEQVRVTYLPITEDGMFGNIEMEASGPWIEAILWEVPLMACLSESYFQSVITDWDYKGQEGQFAIL
jgi:nicotinate phosphoribosyltransferase